MGEGARERGRKFTKTALLLFAPSHCIACDSCGRSVGLGEGTGPDDDDLFFRCLPAVRAQEDTKREAAHPRASTVWLGGKAQPPQACQI